MKIPHEVEEIGDTVQLKVPREDPPAAAELAIALGLRLRRDVLGVVGVGPGVLPCLPQKRVMKVSVRSSVSRNTWEGYCHIATSMVPTCKMRYAWARIVPSIVVRKLGRRLIRGM